MSFLLRKYVKPICSHRIYLCRFYLPNRGYPISDSLLNASCRFAVEQPEQAICILEKENIFTFGMLTPESIERCKIDYKTVSEAQENILHFLQLIEQYEPKALGGKMPDEQFYK